MGLAESLRRAASHLGGGADDMYDAYDDEATQMWDEPDRADEQRRGSRPRPVAVVRPPSLALGVISPQTFDDAQKIADQVRVGAPVIVDLQGCDPVLAGRLIDFCSGLVYALDGQLQYVAGETILLAPSGARLSGDATVGLRDESFFNRM